MRQRNAGGSSELEMMGAGKTSAGLPGPLKDRTRVSWRLVIACVVMEFFFANDFIIPLLPFVPTFGYVQIYLLSSIPARFAIWLYTAYVITNGLNRHFFYNFFAKLDNLTMGFISSAVAYGFLVFTDDHFAHDETLDALALAAYTLHCFILAGLTRCLVSHGSITENQGRVWRAIRIIAPTSYLTYGLYEIVTNQIKGSSDTAGAIFLVYLFVTRKFLTDLFMTLSSQKKSYQLNYLEGKLAKQNRINDDAAEAERSFFVGGGF
eukprot:TRINITY_DN8731_c0_g1_i1.p1 TRINITY_DN8731_c0_g1~~TRINITY_DN8731_c0_g1_i1.p1  ORF type:complete len:264 (-),score=50.56 TRINITY_DN8731_c0_g1_i1:62-853(-)